MSKKKLFLPIFILALVGCATMQPVVRIQPTPPDELTSIRNAPELSLTVTDSRAQSFYGTLPTRKNKEPIPVRSSRPLQDAVRTVLAENLSKVGFQVAPMAPKEASQLAVDMKKLSYQFKEGPTWTEITVVGEMEATAKVDNKIRTKTYNVENGKKWGFRPPPDGHQEYLNMALTELVNSLLMDKSLLEFLAGKE